MANGQDKDKANGCEPSWTLQDAANTRLAIFVECTQVPCD